MAALTLETPRQEATDRIDQAMTKAVCIWGLQSGTSMRSQSFDASAPIPACMIAIFQDDTSP
ncbi:hypothetical protein CO660_30830 [Rhizobium sp. L9]|nr:hypothetical protein CO660_30830 [Rhizobium sp. L9]